MSDRWTILLSRILAGACYFFSLVFFIDRGQFWMAVLIPPPASVLVLLLVRRAARWLTTADE